MKVKALRWSYVPWSEQRKFHRSRATFRVLVAGRQAGKTRAAAAELVRVMLEKPGSYSALLAPTYMIARAAIRTVQELVKDLPGFTWKEQRKELHGPCGSVWGVFSADRKEVVRGPTINGLFWVDEAAFLSETAWTAALGALGAVADARIVVTSTPAGKNWLHREFTSRDPANESFRFKSEDSPYCNRALVARLREKMSRERAAQEFDAVFVDNLLLTFPDRSRLYVDAFPPHQGPLSWYLGVDLGKTQDWTVAILMNSYGEATVLGRWQAGESDEAKFWPTATKRIAAWAQHHGALVVVDAGGPAGGPGGVLADYLESPEFNVRCLRVKTSEPGTKQRFVEQLAADVQWSRVTVLRNEHTDQLDHELGTFQGVKRVVQGREVMAYEGPQLEGEHDDMPISLALANWGRVHGTAPKAREVPDLGPYAAGVLKSRPAAQDRAAPAGSFFGAAAGGGYFFR